VSPGRVLGAVGESTLRGNAGGHVARAAGIDSDGGRIAARWVLEWQCQSPRMMHLKRCVRGHTQGWQGGSSSCARGLGFLMHALALSGEMVHVGRCNRLQTQLSDEVGWSAIYAMFEGLRHFGVVDGGGLSARLRVLRSGDWTLAGGDSGQTSPPPYLSSGSPSG
jgi:hypothetical protein